MIWAHLFCCKNNLHTFFCRKNYYALVTKRIYAPFFVAKTIYALFLSQKTIYALRPESFCALKLPSRKFRLFGPLHLGSASVLDTKNEVKVESLQKRNVKNRRYKTQDSLAIFSFCSLSSLAWYEGQKMLFMLWPRYVECPPQGEDSLCQNQRFEEKNHPN